MEKLKKGEKKIMWQNVGKMGETCWTHVNSGKSLGQIPHMGKSPAQVEVDARNTIKDQIQTTFDDIPLAGNHGYGHPSDWGEI